MVFNIECFTRNLIKREHRQTEIIFFHYRIKIKFTLDLI